jgi:ubiquinone/menaquinone biosynthesis C-methylase UbiE
VSAPAIRRARQAARSVLPVGLVAVALGRRRRPVARLVAVSGLTGLWGLVYARYRANGRRQTADERERLKSANWEAFTRHYNERVPTIAEEFELWGEFHQHRHEMRYDLVADAVRRHLPPGGRVLDVGCGSALVAERITDVEATYIGLDFPAHHISFAAASFADRAMTLRTQWVRGDGEHLPLRDGSVDVVVMSEVIEHLLRPELAVWEVSRVLRPGGVYLMTTNNASEVPLRSPLSHPLAWLEKAIGATRPDLISLRPWVWPEPVHESLLPPGSPPVYLPHTHHIFGETRELFAAAGMDTFQWSTFEVPPPQAAITAWLDRRGEAGRRAVDLIEAAAQRTPLVRRLGCHLFMRAEKVRPPVAETPPPGVWPGPFSAGRPVDRGARA